MVVGLRLHLVEDCCRCRCRCWHCCCFWCRLRCLSAAGAEVVVAVVAVAVVVAAAPVAAEGPTLDCWRQSPRAKRRQQDRMVVEARQVRQAGR